MARVNGAVEPRAAAVRGAAGSRARRAIEELTERGDNLGGRVDEIEHRDGRLVRRDTVGAAEHLQHSRCDDHDVTAVI